MTTASIDDTGARIRPATVVILDFGAQYGQLIARRVREANVYSEILPHDAPWDEIEKRDPAAIILTGGPESTLAPDAPGVDPGVFASAVPLLGICYGEQAMADGHVYLPLGELVGLKRNSPSPAFVSGETLRIRESSTKSGVLETSASTQSLATSLQASRRGFGEPREP